MKKQNVNLKKKNNYLYGLLLLSIFIFIITYVINSQKKLGESGGYNKIVKAVVLEKKYIRVGGRKNIVHYEYLYNGNRYKNHDKQLELSYYESIQINDTIEVMINETYPNFSLIFYEKNKHFWNEKN